jgi:hypothetical protein
MGGLQIPDVMPAFNPDQIQQEAQTGMIHSTSHMSPILQLNAENGAAWMNNATGQNLGTGTTPMGATMDQFGMYQPNQNVLGASGEQAAQTGMMALQNMPMPMPPGVASSMTPPPAPGTYTMPTTPVAQGYMPPSQAATQNQIYPQSYNMDPMAALMGAGGAGAGISGGAAMNGLYRGI